MPIEVGQPAPPFTLKDQDGNDVSLKDFQGKDLVLFFYPKDDTPGCTKEACSFRDHYGEIQELGAVILGVSADGAESHQRFIEKYRLPFSLLSDPDKKMMEEYGAWGQKKLYGNTFLGVTRSTVWIGPDGNVKKHWKRVPKAATHPEKVLEALKAGA